MSSHQILSAIEVNSFEYSSVLMKVQNGLYFFIVYYTYSRYKQITEIDILV